MHRNRKLAHLALFSLFLSPLWHVRTNAAEKGLDLATVVEPSSVFRNNGQTVKFALHGFVEFQTLNELFAHIDAQAGRWQFGSAREREKYASDLLRRGIQSRLISMQYEKPLEILITHTGRELSAAVAGVRTTSAPLIFKGRNWQITPEAYRAIFLELQEHWKSSLNCWSASSSIPGRVLSNWYPIDEGITLFGARYDSTEHFWQAVKYHPEVRLNDLLKLLSLLESSPLVPWVERLAGNQSIFLRHTYAVEFLKANITPQRLQSFRKELTGLAAGGNRPARRLQQRDETDPGRMRFSPLEEKTLWGDLADVFHLIHFFAGTDGAPPADALKPLSAALREHRFDSIYLDGYRTGKMGFISRDFQELMLEIWKVKYLEMERLGDVIRSTKGTYLDHFLNDGDSPDIPIPIYVGFLDRIRDMALQQKR